MMDYRPEDMADDLGVSASTVGRWERDERRPRPGALVKIAKHLGVSAAWLDYGVPEPSNGGPQRITDTYREVEADLDERLRQKPGPKDRRAGGGSSG